MLHSDALENVCHRVTHGWGGGKAEVDDAEGDAKTVACLLGDELTYAGYLEGCAFDGLAEHFEVG